MKNRNALRYRALELVGRDGLSTGEAARRLGVSRNIVVGIDYRAQRGVMPRRVRRAPVPRHLTFGEALQRQSAAPA